MNKRLIAGVLGVLVGAALSAGFAWVSGFNFDHRGPSVADGVFYGALMSGIAGALAAMCPAFD